MAAVRLAVVTDIHHGADTFTKKGTAALPLLDEFRRFVAEARPDAVLDLGDRISDVSRDVDLALEAEVAEGFRGFAAPVHHIPGNHDRDHLSLADNETLFGQSMTHQIVDLGDWRLVLWRADSLIRRPGGFVLTEFDLLWLARTVAQADRPLAIFGHVPVSGHSQEGNYWFANNPEAATYPGTERIRAVLRGARVPIVWIAGHVHWNTATMVDGVPHLTLQSLTETFTCHPEPAAAWGLLELSDRILWRVHGRDPFAFETTTARAAARWVPPLPRFADHPEHRARRAARLAEEAAE